MAGDATAPAWNGCRLTVDCPCGVVFERWVTPQDAAIDLLLADLRAGWPEGAFSKKCVHRCPAGTRSTMFSTADQVTRSVMPLVVPWPAPR
jgi:hypothetical protein